MAKLGFLFITFFIIFQIAYAARLPRDTVETTTTLNLFNQFEDGIAKLQNEFKATFTKENFDKFSDTVSKHASEINSHLKELATDVQSKLTEFSKDGTKDATKAEKV